MNSKQIGNENRRAVTKRSAPVLAALAAAALTGTAFAVDEQSLEARIAVLEKQVQQISEREASASRQDQRDAGRGSHQASTRRTFWEEYWSHKALDRN